MRLPEVLLKTPLVTSEGFEIDPSRTQWVRVQPANDMKNKLEFLFKLKAKEDKSAATFSVRIDKDTAFKNLEEYVNKWLKSYGQFGIEVLGHQYFKNNKDQKGFVIDLTNSTSHKKLRQVLFFRDSKAVVMTCMDHADKFATTLKDCNQLIRSFAWVEKPATTPSEGLR
jgi:hypothetical protein